MREVIPGILYTELEANPDDLRKDMVKRGFFDIETVRSVTSYARASTLKPGEMYIDTDSLVRLINDDRVMGIAVGNLYLKEKNKGKKSISDDTLIDIDTDVSSHILESIINECRNNPWHYLRFVLGRSKKITDKNVREILNNAPHLKYSPIVMRSRSNGKTTGTIGGISEHHAFPFFDEHLFKERCLGRQYIFRKTSTSVLALTIRDNKWLVP